MNKNKKWSIASFGFGILIPILWLVIQLTQSYQWFWFFPAPGPIALIIGVIAWIKQKYVMDWFLTVGIGLGWLGTMTLLYIIFFFHPADIT